MQKLAQSPKIFNLVHIHLILKVFLRIIFYLHLKVSIKCPTELQTTMLTIWWIWELVGKSKEKYRSQSWAKISPKEREGTKTGWTIQTKRKTSSRTFDWITLITFTKMANIFASKRQVKIGLKTFVMNLKLCENIQK